MKHYMLDTPLDVLFAPSIENVNKWIIKLKNLEQSPEVKKEIKKYSDELKRLKE